jgi:hypothetical protein
MIAALDTRTTIRVPCNGGNPIQLIRLRTSSLLPDFQLHFSEMMFGCDLNTGLQQLPALWGTE